MAYTTNQIQLQTLIECGLIPGWRIDFAASIANKHNLSVKQHEWVGKIIDETLIAMGKYDAPVSHDFKPMFDLFNTAMSHGLKWPKVSLVYQTTGNQHTKLMIKRLSDTAKRPNSLGLVLDGAGYLGCIDKNTHEIVWVRNVDESVKRDVKKLLLEFNADPKGVAMAHGKLMSSCCFCRLPLSTPESLAAGYGDTCAKHWKLPWGNVKLTQVEALS